VNEARQAVVVPTIDLHSTAPYTRLAVSPHHTHVLHAEETALLKSNYDPYLYNAPENTNNEGYKTHFAGLSKKRLADLPLPGIPPDRDLEPPNRHDELLKIPVNQEPLPKDLRAPVYLDHHRSTTSEMSGSLESKDESRPKSRASSAGHGTTNGGGSLMEDSVLSNSVEASQSSTLSNGSANMKRKQSKLLKQKSFDTPSNPVSSSAISTKSSASERNSSPMKGISRGGLSTKSAGSSLGQGSSGGNTSGSLSIGHAPPSLPGIITGGRGGKLPKLPGSRKSSKSGSSSIMSGEGGEYDEDDFEQPSYFSR
jgi:hypothetical protein